MQLSLTAITRTMINVDTDEPNSLIRLREIAL